MFTSLCNLVFTEIQFLNSFKVFVNVHQHTMFTVCCELVWWVMVSLRAVQQRPLWLKMVYIENTLFFSNWKRKFFHQPCLIFLQGLFLCWIWKSHSQRKEQNNTQHLCRQFYHNLISFHLTLSPLLFSVKPDCNPGTPQKNFKIVERYWKQGWSGHLHTLSCVKLWS